MYGGRLTTACCPPLIRSYWDRIRKSPLGMRFAQGVFWSMTGALWSRVMMMVSAMLVARMLGKASYGELGIIQSTIGMFGVFAGFGLGMTSTKYVAEFRNTDPGRAGRILGMADVFAFVFGASMAVALFFAAPWLAGHTLNAPHLGGILRSGSILLFLSALNGAQTGALSGFEAFKSIAVVNLAVGLISFPILLAGVWYKGINGAVWALILTSLMNWLFNHLALRKEAARSKVSFQYRGILSELPILWKFSLPAVLTGILYTPVTWLCSTLLVREPNGYSEMGLYNAANQWFGFIIYIPGILGSVILPMLSERLGENDVKRSVKIMSLGIKTNFLVTVPLVLAGSVASPYIMAFYGEGFREGWPTMVAVLCTAAYMACQTPITQFITASGRMWTGFALNIVWSVSLIIFTKGLVHQGAFGFALARSAAFVMQSFFIILVALRLIRKASGSNHQKMGYA